MNTQQNVDKQIHDKQKKRNFIRHLYTVQRWAFRVFICFVILIFLTLLIGLIGFKTSWGALLLSGSIPWKWIIVGTLLLGFVFIYTDTFVQSKEERWFRHYGRQITATVTSFDEVNRRAWLRWFPSDMQEYRLTSAWTHTENGQVYSYSRRVRDRNLPNLGTQIPIIIDYDDPTYYLEEDFKRANRSSL